MKTIGPPARRRERHARLGSKRTPSEHVWWSLLRRRFSLYRWDRAIRYVAYDHDLDRATAEAWIYEAIAATPTQLRVVLGRRGDRFLAIRGPEGERWWSL